jgi:hydroxymethylpyrimidine pyrophosphatase-like HAD family hydrolase
VAITYENVFFDYVLDPLRDIFISEYNYGKIYIAPNILYKDPFSIRIWGEGAETNEYFATAWQKQYNIEISLYEIDKNPGEEFYKQFYNDIERVYQLLFTNAKIKSSTVNTIQHKWLDGVCEEVSINEFAEGEEEIDGLNVAKFIFNCKLTRENS